MFQKDTERTNILENFQTFKYAMSRGELVAYLMSRKHRPDEYTGG